jgi:HEPN domain-containing protein
MACQMIAFDAGKTVSYWFRGAKYDFGVATALFKAKKYPYALFMGHLALEKLLKAFVVYSVDLVYLVSDVPLSHSVS